MRKPKGKKKRKEKKKQEVLEAPPIKVPCPPQARQRRSPRGALLMLPGLLLAWAGLPAFRPDVILVHLFVKLSATHVFPRWGRSVGRLGEARRPALPGPPAQNARTAAPSSVASTLTRYAGMLGCGCTGTMTAGHPFFGARLLYLFDAALPGACSGLRPAQCTFWGGKKKGGSVKGEKQHFTTSRRARGTGIKKQQRQEAAQERHMASRGKE